MHRKFRVVAGDNNPASVFDDLSGLRTAMPPVARRARSSATFARIPHKLGLALRGLHGNAWLILIELDRQILLARGRNPIRLTNARLKELGINRTMKQRQLRRLEAAGVLRIQTEERKGTIVQHLWFSVQG